MQRVRYVGRDLRDLDLESGTGCPQVGSRLEIAGMTNDSASRNGPQFGSTVSRRRVPRFGGREQIRMVERADFFGAGLRSLVPVGPVDGSLIGTLTARADIAVRRTVFLKLRQRANRVLRQQTFFKIALVTLRMDPILKTQWAGKKR